jgi:hypothetical protein
MDLTQLDVGALTANWWQTILFCLGIYTVVYLLRISVEWKWPSVKAPNSYWLEVALPTIPVVLGVCVALAFKSYPYPAQVQSGIARAFYGGVCGFFSAWVYRVGKAVVKKLLDGKGVVVDPGPSGAP